jgi:RimJ/RimL family protein N-acetyltransferase
LERSRTLLHTALPAGHEAFAAVPHAYLPLIRALCDVQTEEVLAVYALPSERFKPLLNVLATREDESDGSPRFVVKQLLNGQRTAVAAAGVNWLSPRFGEIAVRTRPEYRQKGFGRGVVATLAEYLLAHGRTPLYAVNPTNTPSIHLAESLGFVPTGTREWMLEIKMR